MGRAGKLTALEINAKAKPGLYGDGGGLYLQVSRFHTKSWVFQSRSTGGLARWA